MINFDELPLWLKIANIAGHVIFVGVAFWALRVYIQQARETDDPSERRKKRWLAAGFLMVALYLTAELILLLTTGEGVVESLHAVWF